MFSDYSTSDLCNMFIYGFPGLPLCQVLEVVRSNYDTLTLKLQDGLDQFERYSEQPKEAAFFKELVRDAATAACR